MYATYVRERYKSDIEDMCKANSQNKIYPLAQSLHHPDRIWYGHVARYIVLQACRWMDRRKKWYKTLFIDPKHSTQFAEKYFEHIPPAQRSERVRGAGVSSIAKNARSRVVALQWSCGTDGFFVA